VAFLQGFCHFRHAERGEMYGKTWSIRGENVAANDSKSGHEKHATFLHIF
jgi:hypothetical protein